MRKGIKKLDDSLRVAKLFCVLCTQNHLVKTVPQLRNGKVCCRGRKTPQAPLPVVKAV